MAGAKREKTKYPGVYFRQQMRPDGSGPERAYYIMYRRGGRGSKLIEEPVGRESEGMTAAKANIIRAARMSGKEASNTERREKARIVSLQGEGPLTFGRLWELYLEAGSDKPSIRGDAIRYARHLERPLAAKLPEQITTADLAAIRKRMEKKGLAAQTVKHALGQVRRILKYGQKVGLCTLPGNLLFEMPKVDNVQTECMTDEQRAAYLHALDEEEDQVGAAYLRLVLLTGMRKTAMLALQWDDVDFERGIITLRGDVAKKCKTEHIPLTAAARAVLEAVPRTGSPFIFPGRGGRQRDNFTRMARRVRDKAGLPASFRPVHGLRHSYASALASSGKVDLYTLQRLLTHESPAMTQRYAHLADEALRKAAAVADELLAAPTGEDTAVE